MWEAKCVPGRVEQTLAWIKRELEPSANQAGATAIEVFRSEDRVVVITRWSGPTDWTEPSPYPTIVERYHAWPFEPA